VGRREDLAAGPLPDDALKIVMRGSEEQDLIASWISMV
jgi:hypothetical protein